MQLIEEQDHAIEQPPYNKNYTQINPPPPPPQILLCLQCFSYNHSVWKRKQKPITNEEQLIYSNKCHRGQADC